MFLRVGRLGSCSTNLLRKMSGAVLVAIAASIGNLLQGWDNATIAGTCFILLL